MKNLMIIPADIPQWKGNLHTHTTRSDGKHPVNNVLLAYKMAGYNFCAITDHEIYFDCQGMDDEKFLALAGTETSIKMNPVHTWELDYRMSKDDYHHARHKHMHYCCIKDEETAGEGNCFKHDELVPRMIDTGIDSWNEEVAYMKARHNLVIINHPDWSRLAPEMMLACHGEIAFEVYNSGNVQHCGGHDDTAIWDYCLQHGKRLLAVAADDAHALTSDFAAGFTMVYCQKLTRLELCRALKQGCFYASTGPVIHEMKVENGYLKMRFTPAKYVRLAAYDGEATTFWAEEGKLLEEIEYKIDERLKYIRPMVIDDAGKTAWAQPVYIQELIDDGKTRFIADRSDRLYGLTDYVRRDPA